jgi:nudix-type nucleoside diphosphatase (YffH/AdpP family)
VSDDPLLERVAASDRIYDGRILNVRVDTVEMADGRSARREIVEHAAVVAIVPVDSRGNVVLVRQYRLAAEEALLEIPAGGVDEGEDIEAAAQREMQEEIGHRAGILRRLAGFYVSPGYITEYIHAFLATELVEEPAPGDEDEQIEIVRVPLEDALRLIETGDIKDAKSIIGLTLAAQALLG